MTAAEEVIAAAEERARALAAGDAARLRQLLHERFTWTSHVGEVLDRTEYVRRNTEGHTVWLAQRLDAVEVAVVGDTAVLRAEVTDEVASSEGSAETFRMPVTQVWVRVAGAWACLAGHAGPRRP
ncbi:nuclear transport factor 2 family protein [Nocardioides caricicola]|uniref:Nuclear transport factor 2 family protein n=1 Tax=Nocardioides caricicola TaxID=634770 RepID=A0ABW0MYB9_9ACTN